MSIPSVSIGYAKGSRKLTRTSWVMMLLSFCLAAAGLCQRLAARRLLLAALSAAATLGLFGGVRHAYAGCDPVVNGLTCMDDVTSCSLHCTANDVRLAVYNISGTCSVGGAVCVVNNSPVCDGIGGVCAPDLINCTPGDMITVSLQAQLVAGAKERYDIGLYIAQDGGDALTGDCFVTFLDATPLEPGTTGDCTPVCNPGGEACFTDADCFNILASCDFGYDPDSGAGPYYDGECSEDPLDLCGDLEQGVDTFLNLGPVTFICADSDGDGKADIGTCTSWDNARSDGGNKPSCMNQDDTLPSTPSKCRCEPIAIGCVCLECQACDANLDCQPVADGEGCMDTDNNACTTPGCEAGVCVQDHIVVDCTGVMLDECNNAACDPTTGLCTVPDPKPLSTVCGAGDLCAPQHCDGAGNCVPNGPPVDCTGVMLDECNNGACDPATGLCTVPDPKPLSTVCGAGDLCAPEHCDGAGSCVPNGPPVDCTGVMLDECNNGACDPATGLCTAPVAKPAGTVCNRGSGDICDPDELCTGVAGEACPPDVVLPPTTICNPGSGDICDPDESCTGLAGDPCPDDTISSPTTICRAGSGDVCDPDESCTGEADGACPPDVVTPPTTICNPGSGDICDPDESCTGVPGDACPADTIAPPTTICRAGSGGVCDPGESCTGVADDRCPPDVFAPLSTSCETDENSCTTQHCDGAGSCVVLDIATEVTYRVVVVSEPTQVVECHQDPGQECPPEGAELPAGSDMFWVEVWVQTCHPAGIACAALDLLYTGDAPVEVDSIIHGCALDQLPTGEPQNNGDVLNLAGCAFAPQVGVDSRGWALVASVKYVRHLCQDVHFAMRENDHAKTSIFGIGLADFVDLSSTCWGHTDCDLAIYDMTGDCSITTGDFDVFAGCWKKCPGDLGKCETTGEVCDTDKDCVIGYNPLTFEDCLGSYNTGLWGHSCDGANIAGFGICNGPDGRAGECLCYPDNCVGPEDWAFFLPGLLHGIATGGDCQNSSEPFPVGQVPLPPACWSDDPQMAGQLPSLPTAKEMLSWGLEPPPGDWPDNDRGILKLMRDAAPVKVKRRYEKRTGTGRE